MNMKEETAFMRPSEILFSQEEIPSRFSDFGELHQVVGRLIIHPKLINTIPLMTVSNRNDGEWHTENNRRLYVFRVLEKKKVLEKVQVNRTKNKAAFSVKIVLLAKSRFMAHLFGSN